MGQVPLIEPGVILYHSHEIHFAFSKSNDANSKSWQKGNGFWTNITLSLPKAEKCLQKVFLVFILFSLVRLFWVFSKTLIGWCILSACLIERLWVSFESCFAANNIVTIHIFCDCSTIRFFDCQFFCVAILFHYLLLLLAFWMHVLIHDILIVQPVIFPGNNFPDKMHYEGGLGCVKKLTRLRLPISGSINSRFPIAFSGWWQLKASWRTRCILTVTKRRRKCYQNHSNILVGEKGKKKGGGEKEKRKKSLPLW